MSKAWLWVVWPYLREKDVRLEPPLLGAGTGTGGGQPTGGGANVVQYTSERATGFISCLHSLLGGVRRVTIRAID